MSRFIRVKQASAKLLIMPAPHPPGLFVATERWMEFNQAEGELLCIHGRRQASESKFANQVCVWHAFCMLCDSEPETTCLLLSQCTGRYLGPHPRDRCFEASNNWHVIWVTNEVRPGEGAGMLEVTRQSNRATKQSLESFLVSRTSMYAERASPHPRPRFHAALHYMFHSPSQNQQRCMLL